VLFFIDISPNRLLSAIIVRFERGNIGFFFLFIIAGGVLGSVLGMFLSELFPSLTIITKSLTDFLTVDLQMIKIAVRLNISSCIGIIAGIVVYLKV